MTVHAGSATTYRRTAPEAKPTLESLGVRWKRTETEPAWLAPIICPFSGGWEVDRGSRAEQVVRGTPEFKDCRAAAMTYLKSHENYADGAALHKAHGSLDEYHRQLGYIADDYALRVCINDHWHIGASVADPGPADAPQPASYVPMRDRVLAAGHQAPAPVGTEPRAPGSIPDPGAGAAVPVPEAESTAVPVPEGSNNIVHLPRARRETPQPEREHDEIDDRDDIGYGHGFR
jgi:hypothetical protein